MDVVSKSDLRLSGFLAFGGTAASVWSERPIVGPVKEVVSELGRNLDAAKKHLAEMKRESADDKNTLAAIAKIEKRLDNAFALHKEAHACCVEDFDEGKALKCCGDLTKELDQIIADHNHLMKSLAPKKPAKSSK